MPATQVAAGAVTAVILFAITTPWLRSQFRRTDPDLANLVTLALAAKLLASIARYFVAYQIYGGVADAAQYYTAGKALASPFRHFHFSHLDVGRVIGTGFMKILTGIVFAVTGVSEIGGYFIFSWLGFLGLWLFYRAFRIAVPEGSPRTYAWLVFLLPSMLFWPSEIGKEAWMTLGLGFCAYGAARVLVRRRWGYTFTGLGCVTTGLVRPHITLLFLGAFLVAMLVRRDSTSPSLVSKRRRGSKFIGLIILVAGLLLAVTRANSFFSSDSLQGAHQGLTGILSGTSVRTTQGGSRFAPASLSRPWSIPYAVLSVTFRPFPFEARNVQSFLSSLEGAFLLYLVWRTRKRLRNLWRWMIARPYLLLCLIYSLLFAFAYSAVGNFGILARERVMQFPFFVAILALPSFRPGQTDAPEGEAPVIEEDVPEPNLVLSPARLARSRLSTETRLWDRPPGLLPSPSGRQAKAP